MALLLSYSEILIGCLVLLFTYYLVLKRSIKNKKWPPGPTPYPIVGNLFQLGRQPHLSFAKWAKIYGPIIGLQVGSEKIVVITDPNIAKELYSDMRACGRPKNPILSEYGKGNLGFLTSDGSNWVEQRRFAIRTLNQLGLSKTSREEPILRETGSLLNFLQKRTGHVVSGKGLFNGAVLNIIWSIVSGEREEWDAQERPEITKASQFTERINRIMYSGLVFLPFLKHIAPRFFGWTQFLESIKDLNEMMEVSTEKHIKMLDPSNPKDFIDHYLIEMEKETNPGSSFYKQKGRKNLTQTIMDLFVAGAETTSDSLEYIMMYMSYRPEMQRKLQEEIDAVIGSRQPSLADRPLMPYTEAILLEMFRLHPNFPAGLPRKMLETMKFHGYILPKDTVLLFDMYNILRDRAQWGEDVNSFRPERFLSENDDERKLIRRDNFIAFSVGKRQCPGEGLARDSLFLFVTSIFQRFNVETDTNCPVPDFSPISGVIWKPKPFNIVVTERNVSS